MRGWKLGKVKYCVTKSSWMCPVTTTNSLPVLFWACSLHATLCPSSRPPQKPVSISLASPAMTQHWPTTEHALTHTRTHKYTHTHIHTSFCSIHLGAWLSPFPWFSLSFDPLCPLIWGSPDVFRFMHPLFPPWLKATLMLSGKTKRLMQFCMFFVCSYPGPLTLT